MALPRVNAPDRLDQIFAHGCLQEITHGASLECLAGLCITAVRSEYDAARARRSLNYSLDRLYSIHPGHLQINQRHIRLMLLECRDSIISIRNFCHEDHIRFSFDSSGNTVKYQRMIVST
jgi:hypothetical protein